MLADAARIMPDALKFEADQRFFEHALDAVDVVVHGRHSQERQKRSHLRHRLMVTRRVPAIAPHPSNAMALLWNPAGASFEEALLALGTPGAVVGVIGGPDVFALFLDRYDAFHLSRAPDVRLPAAVRCFRKCPFARPRKPQRTACARSAQA
jgi:dihydrofolate reductase